MYFFYIPPHDNSLPRTSKKLHISATYRKKIFFIKFSQKKPQLSLIRGLPQPDYSENKRKTMNTGKQVTKTESSKEKPPIKTNNSRNKKNKIPRRDVAAIIFSEAAKEVVYAPFKTGSAVCFIHYTQREGLSKGSEKFVARIIEETQRAEDLSKIMYSPAGLNLVHGLVKDSDDLRNYLMIFDDRFFVNAASLRSKSNKKSKTTSSPTLFTLGLFYGYMQLTNDNVEINERLTRWKNIIATQIAPKGRSKHLFKNLLFRQGHYTAMRLMAHIEKEIYTRGRAHLDSQNPMVCRKLCDLTNPLKKAS